MLNNVASFGPLHLNVNQVYLGKQILLSIFYRLGIGPRVFLFKMVSLLRLKITEQGTLGAVSCELFHFVDLFTFLFFLKEFPNLVCCLS